MSKITKSWWQVIRGFRKPPTKNALLIEGLSYDLNIQVKDKSLYVLSFKKDGNDLSVSVLEVNS